MKRSMALCLRTVLILLTFAIYLGTGCVSSKKSSVDNTNDGSSGGDLGADVLLADKSDPGDATADGSSDGNTLSDGAENDGTTDKISFEDVEPGKFMAPCQGNKDCDSGFCVAFEEGYVCTKKCLQECPDGWNCKAAANTVPDVVFICVPDTSRLCRPCKSDFECNGALCTKVGDSNYCGQNCDDDKAKCPEGYTCKDQVGTSGTTAKQCVPDTGVCDCNKSTAGATRLCENKDDAIGTCVGFETCDPAKGWTNCTAEKPELEVCDGKDNDCNGIADDNLPLDKECENKIDGIGTCKGVEICFGTGGPKCNAPEPKVETCNGLDDNCDGEIDEDFKNSKGQYDKIEHCGACGVSCVGKFQNGTGKCDSSGVVPQCVLDQCSSGYTKTGNLCIPTAPNLCAQCQVDVQCFLQSDKCVQLTEGKFCGRDCSATSPHNPPKCKDTPNDPDCCPNGANCCPADYECKEFDTTNGKIQQCVPKNGSCTCTPDKDGNTRPCQNKVDGIGTCLGVETCDKDQGWINCNAKTPEKETCDGDDNDCNNEIDDKLDLTNCENKVDNVGTCTGVQICDAQQKKIICTAKTPKLEECDLEDNDCDGEIDEDFKTNGKYTHIDHCGACGNGCLNRFDNATGKCGDTFDPPKCVIDKCNPGYVKLSDFSCVPEVPNLCANCLTDTDCFLPTDRCLDLDEGRFCGRDCNPGNSYTDEKCKNDPSYCCPDGANCCPSGFKCLAVDPNVTPQDMQCQPTNGTCTCNQDNDTKDRLCEKTVIGVGKCTGVQTCSVLTGWSTCNAETPTAEICNGKDDNCDGLKDEGLNKNEPCQVTVQGVGTCTGVKVCDPAKLIGDLVCNAPTPSPETCNLQDDNCNNQIDETFKNTAGKYNHIEHCGICGNSCVGFIDDGKSKCDDTFTVPRCVVDTCDVGFYKANIVTCAPLVPTQCKSCSVDADCTVPGDKCVDLQDGRYCVQGCEANGPRSAQSCPAGSVQGSQDGMCVCKPTNNTCTCTKTGDTKQCFNNVAGVGTCTGKQTCNVTTGWSVCDAKTPKVEECNGEDDNCNFLIDEGLNKGTSCTKQDPAQKYTCTGVMICDPLAKMMVCNATTPMDEICDNLDNNCENGEDEDFKTGDKYTHINHCGQCGVNCETKFQNASEVFCDSTLGTPVCKIKTCEDGFVKFSDFSCIPAPDNLCEACVTDDQCVGQNDYCVDLADYSKTGKYCGRDCSATSDYQPSTCTDSSHPNYDPNGPKCCPNGAECCPNGFFCDTGFNPTPQCVPGTSTNNVTGCDCNADNVGLKRQCESTVVQGCFGEETCQNNGGSYDFSSCTFPVEECDLKDNNCDGEVDEIFLTDVGGVKKYTTDAHCGTCGNNCNVIFQGDESYGKCVLDSNNNPVCELRCNATFYDVDKNPTNGCECEKESDTDLPDETYKDSNCDGMDGDENDGIFVSKSGSDTTGDGTRDKPVLTIQKGIDLAKAQSKRNVYVSTGLYNENIQLRQGVHIYGGYSPDFTKRDVADIETVLFATTPDGPANKLGAVNCIEQNQHNLDAGLNTTTARLTVDGFIIFGYNNSTASGNTYAVYVRNCDALLTLSNNRIIAGTGGPGDRGNDGIRGKDGVPGQKGNDSKTLTNSCSLNDHVSGGLGGGVTGNNGPGTSNQGTCNTTDDVVGGKGGDSICPDWDENSTPGGNTNNPTCWVGGVQQTTGDPNGVGKPGLGPVGKIGTGGDHGTDQYTDGCYDNSSGCTCGYSSSQRANNCGTCWFTSGGTAANPGKRGNDGIKGDDGTLGLGCGLDEGTVNGNGEWVGFKGNDGTDGKSGGGGGGGGSGGGVERVRCPNTNSNPTPILGSSGGGGGSAACGGTGGTGGKHGGGSFAVFIAFVNYSTTYGGVQPQSAPVLVKNTITIGKGGVGGDGGTGAVGGVGGVGGDPGDVVTGGCTPKGGQGGYGGNGGHGAGGGGGCGGVSYGIFLWNPGTVIDSTTLATNYDTGNFWNAVPPKSPGGRGGISFGQAGTKGNDGDVSKVKIKSP